MFGLNHYHDTVIESVALADQYEHKAKHQDEIVLKLFQQHPTASFTPYEVWLRLGQQWPITSVRRAITNLTGEFLEVTEEKRLGGYGRNNNVWRLKKNQ